MDVRQEMLAAPQPVLPVVGDPGRPGFLLRVAARLLLSPFAIRRVNHPHVLNLLGDVARQSGRMDALLQIQAKLRVLDVNR